MLIKNREGLIVFLPDQEEIDKFTEEGTQAVAEFIADQVKSGKNAGLGNALEYSEKVDRIVLEVFPYGFNDAAAQIATLGKVKSALLFLSGRRFFFKIRDKLQDILPLN